MAGRCAAFAKTGERCRNPAGDDARYCHLHKEAFEEIEGFFARNKDHFVGFVLGVLTETIVDDAYDGLRRFIAAPGATPEVSDADRRVVRDLGGYLGEVLIDGRRFRIEFLLARPPAEGFAVYECLYPNEPGERGATGYGTIHVYYIDELGRRHVGDLGGQGVRPDNRTSPARLISGSPRSPGDTEEYYELTGRPGRERLELIMIYDGAEVQYRGRYRRR